MASYMLRYNKEMKPDHESDTDLSLPPKSVALGEKPSAPSDQPKRMVLGSAKGEFTVPDDFDDPLPKEIEDLFWK